MKIINLITNNVFDLPKCEAEFLLKNSPQEFVKYSKNKKFIQKNKIGKNTTVLSMIIDE